MRLTKIDVAEAHLISAVRLRFGGGHPASIYLLAASAREILTTIGQKVGTRTMLAGIAETTGKSIKELITAASEYVAFFKHADRDPASVLEKFDEDHADLVLFIACHDFHRVAKGQPIELQVYEAWHLAQVFKKVSEAPLRVQPIVRKCIRLFPGIRAASAAERQRMGLEQLEKARRNPALQMEIRREVILPGDPQRAATVQRLAKTLVDLDPGLKTPR
jgi:hypothetical protein